MREVAEKARGRSRREVETVWDVGLYDDGRIPFRIRIGVTGHRDIASDPEDAIHQALDRVYDLVLGMSADASSVTEVELAVVSELAEGADRLIVEHVFAYAARRGQEARLEVVLPMQRDQYAELQGFDDASRAELGRMLSASTFQIEPPRAELRTSRDRENAYVAAAKKVIGRCDVLIALWDGKDPVKRGGSAYTLLNAAAHGKPCIWIPTEAHEQTRDNLEIGSSRTFLERVSALSGSEPDHVPSDDVLDRWSLKSLAQVVRALDVYNLEPRSRSFADPSTAGLSGLVLNFLDRALGRRFESGFQRSLKQEIDDRLADRTPPWLAAPFARSSLLAQHYDRWFKLLSGVVLLSVSLAAGMLAVGVGSGAQSAIWSGLEFGFLIIAAVAFVVVRTFGFHGRWLSCRVLAERFRTARYVARTGIDFRDHARLQGVWTGGASEEWLMRAFEEVWDREPHETRISDDKLEELKTALADDWIQGQIDYHKAAKREHDRLKQRLSVTAYVSFGLTLLCALLDAVLAGLHVEPAAENIATGLTIFLPVFGASIGAALTINQHHALAERSTRMQSDLQLVKEELEAAVDARTLRDATIAAAGIIAPETGTWFGALWFLDIEHP